MMNGWELTFGIIASIGALATAGAFIALFRKDKHKQNQIDKLTNIAGELEVIAEQSIRPIIEVGFTYEYDNIYNLRVFNKGPEFVLEKIVFAEATLHLTKTKLPTRLHPGGNVAFNYRLRDPIIKKSAYIIIIYRDVRNKQYEYHLNISVPQV